MRKSKYKRKRRRKRKVRRKNDEEEDDKEDDEEKDDEEDHEEENEKEVEKEDSLGKLSCIFASVCTQPDTIFHGHRFNFIFYFIFCLGLNSCANRYLRVNLLCIVIAYEIPYARLRCCCIIKLLRIVLHVYQNSP